MQFPGNWHEIYLPLKEVFLGVSFLAFALRLSSFFFCSRSSQGYKLQLPCTINHQPNYYTTGIFLSKCSSSSNFTLGYNLNNFLREHQKSIFFSSWCDFFLFFSFSSYGICFTLCSDVWATQAICRSDILAVLITPTCCFLQHTQKLHVYAIIDSWIVNFSIDWFFSQAEFSQYLNNKCNLQWFLPKTDKSHDVSHKILDFI